MRFQLDPTSPSGLSIASEPQRPTNRGGFAGSPDITRVLQPGTNVTFTGNGTQQSPYVINATSGGGSFSPLTPVTPPAYTQGALFYDNTSESLSFYNNDSTISLQIGQEEWIRVKNVTGSTIANGSAVYISGASSGLPTIALAKADVGSTTIGMGLTTESIVNNATGYVTSLGVVHGINTSAFTAGLPVYISDTVAGALTQTAPVAPSYRYRVGIVAVSDASVGSIHVTPSTASLGNGAANQLFGMNTAGTAQELKTIAAGSGVTVTPSAGVITIASTGGGSGTVTSVDVSGGTTGLTTSGGPVTTSGVITIAGILAVSNGGTGSATQNFVDLTTNQTVAGVKTFSGKPAISSGELDMTSSTSNLILMTAAGAGAPAFTTRSAGTKLVLYNTLSGSLMDAAIGVQSNAVWHSIFGNSATYSFIWYGGTTAIMTLNGLGALNIASTITTPLEIQTNQAITVVTNAGTADVTHGTQTFTNSSAAAITITLAISGAVDGQKKIIRIYDFSAVTQSINWVNAENSSIIVPATTNGSTTLPLTVGLMYNSATSRWRCIAVA